MILYNNKDLKLLVGDIETLRPCTDLGFYNPDTGTWYEFQMNAYRNDIDSFIKFYTEGGWDYIVGYNFKNFDAQVIQHIINNHQKWFDLTGLGIAGEVYKFTQKLIDDQNYDLFAPFKESQFSVKVLDVYLIFGLDNEARRSSLKKCEFQIDYHSVEEMPIFHGVDTLSEEETKKVSDYRRNDVLATYELLKIACGNTELPLYKYNNQLELRDNISEEFKIDCMNFSDIKMGDELIKKAYAQAIGKKVIDLPRKGTFRKTIKLSKCIPETIEYQTDLLKNLHSKLKKTTLTQIDKWEEKFVIGNTSYVQSLGGLHSVNKNQIFEEDEYNEIITCDVSSMYPKSIINNSYFPAHLGKELLVLYKELYEKRLKLKPLAKKDKKIKGIVEALKLQMNIVFGKMGSMESWLYDKQALLSITLTGQYSLLMLIEKLELNGIRVIVANTDGIESIVPKDKKELYYIICKEWENKTNYTLEYDHYKKMYMFTVNDYLAITTSGDVKKKGDAITNFELWKNKSSRVIPLALEEYFINKKDPIEFIKNHKNIYDFCIMARATGRLHLEEQWEEDGKVQTQKHKKLIRYYISNKSKKQLYKRGIGTTDKESNKILHAADAIGNIHTQYFNQFEEKDNYNIAYNHYILKVLDRIDAIEKTKKAKSYADTFKPQQQLTMF